MITLTAHLSADLRLSRRFDRLAQVLDLDCAKGERSREATIARMATRDQPFGAFVSSPDIKKH